MSLAWTHNSLMYALNDSNNFYIIPEGKVLYIPIMVKGHCLNQYSDAAQP